MGKNANRQAIASVQLTRSTLASHSAFPRGMNVKRLNANRAMRIAAQRTQGLWGLISVFWGEIWPPRNASDSNRIYPSGPWAVVLHPLNKKLPGSVEAFLRNFVSMFGNPEVKRLSVSGARSHPEWGRAMHRPEPLLTMNFHPENMGFSFASRGSAHTFVSLGGRRSGEGACGGISASLGGPGVFGFPDNSRQWFCNSHRAISPI